jgi:8-oxo-dGTP pyrophosphatase MutT (NUDIX family)
MRDSGMNSRLMSPFARLAHLYWRFSRGLTLGVRAVVIDGDGRVLLVKHRYTPGWHLPGGGVEPGETLLEALTRELGEECGIEPLAPPALHGILYHPAFSRRDHVALFVVRAFRRTGAQPRRLEISDHGFFPPDALPEDTTAGTNMRIAEVLTGAPPPERW